MKLIEPVTGINTQEMNRLWEAAIKNITQDSEGIYDKDLTRQFAVLLGIPGATDDTSLLVFTNEHWNKIRLIASPNGHIFYKMLCAQFEGQL